jgi:hypothetical protein
VAGTETRHDLEKSKQIKQPREKEEEMKAKTVFLSMLFLVCLTTLAWADGAIWGHIAYVSGNCNASEDMVCIRPVAGGPCYMTPVIFCHAPYYDTRDHSFPPGSYYIYVVTYESDCVGCKALQSFVHGNDRQQCDIEACGPEIPSW